MVFQEVPTGEKDFERDAEDAQPVVLDETGKEVVVLPKWAHKTIVIQGREIQVKAPQPAAIHFIGSFGIGSKGISKGVMSEFMWRHISEFSVGQIQDWAFEGEVDDEFLEELFSALVELGSNRPTPR